MYKALPMEIQDMPERPFYNLILKDLCKAIMKDRNDLAEYDDL